MIEALKNSKFRIEELVPKAVYEVLGDRSILLFPNKLLISLFTLRKSLDTAFYLNTWILGGDCQYRGYRPYNCSIGATRSAHKVSMAFDIVSKFTGEEMREHILKNQNLYPHITRIENNVPHLHFEITPTGKNKIEVFLP